MSAGVALDPILRPTVIHRSCPICEASCGLRLEVDRAAKRVLSVRGDEDDPRSRGYLCPKATAPQAIHADPDRLVPPLRPARHDGPAPKDPLEPHPLRRLLGDPDPGHRSHRLPARAGREPARLEREPDFRP